MNDQVNKPAHYTHSEIEPIDVTEQWNLDFFMGNAVKYIARAGKKNSEDIVDDLGKAIWYLQRAHGNECARIAAVPTGKSVTDLSIDGHPASKDKIRPQHYGGDFNPHEPVKVIEYYSLKFHLGNVIKYILRSPFKNAELQDLKKAAWYLNRFISYKESANETSTAED